MDTTAKKQTSHASKKISNKGYSSSYQEKLDNAISEAKKSKTVQSVAEFLKDVRAW